ncbi:MAG: prolipoprotein diacylglyceryl transferase family protein [Elusimicrobiota bacterium]
MWPVIHLGDTVISTYGLLVTLGYTIGIFWCMANVKRAEASMNQFWALGFTLIFGALTGARLGYYVVEWDSLAAGALFSNWRSGWVFWTGFVGSMVTGKLFQIGYNSFNRPRRYLQIADFFGPALAFGHTLGRIGCFAEGCCYGTPTSMPWGVKFSHAACSVDGTLLGTALHPVQLYEAFGSACLFAFFAFYVLPRIHAKKLTYGTSFLGYICLYAVMRFFLEFLRGDDRGVFLWDALSPSQWFSLGALIVAGGRLYYQGIFERHPDTRTVYLDSEPS